MTALIAAGDDLSLKAIGVGRLYVSNFRSYPSFLLDIHKPIICLTGPNGSGKTNLLEAVSLLASRRGLRGASTDRFLHQGSGDHLSLVGGNEAGWSVNALLKNSDGMGFDITTFTDPLKHKNRRCVTIDGQRKRGVGAVQSLCHVCWLTPQMDDVLDDGLRARRDWFDHLLTGYEPAYGDQLKAYEKCMRERLSVLRGANDDRWLGLLEKQMAQAAVGIMADRVAFVERLSACTRSLRTGFPHLSVHMDGVESWLEEDGAFDVQTRLQGVWSQSRDRDRESGGMQEGPHKSDFVVTHELKKCPAYLCSTGEQKALILSALLGYVRLYRSVYDRPLIVLLDEVCSHLDAKHRAEILTELVHLGVQIWLTGTEKSVFDLSDDVCQWIEL
jgi:DNA replication and repair protein RecF